MKIFRVRYRRRHQHRGLQATDPDSMQPASRPRISLASPAWLAIGPMTHVSATALGGWLIAQADALAAGLCLLLVATGAAALQLVRLEG